MTIGKNKPIPDNWLEGMYQRLQQRGPDGNGVFHDQVNSSISSNKNIQVALVHSRLSIIDHEHGTQPMVFDYAYDTDEKSQQTSRKKIAVVFNGCIYNHRELRSELEGMGHKFQSDHSDTEVLIHGHKQWGIQLPKHLEGMYAFVIWDGMNNTLNLYRDRAGEKPLYYWLDEINQSFSVVAFASTIPALHYLISQYTSIDKNSDWWAENILTGYCTDIKMPYAGIKQIPPAKSISFNGETRQASEQTYWQPPARLDKSSSPEARADFDDLLRQAVKARLEADVPLGCFLSGGVDSSLIAYYAQQELPGDLHTFSVKMPDTRYDESHHAETVAKHLGTQHTTLEIDANSPADDLIHLVTQLGMPFGDSSILPTYWVSRAARQHVKVVLSGDGGDELFAGYERYKAADWLSQYNTLLKFIPHWPLCRFNPKSRLNKLARLGSAARGQGYCDLLNIFDTPMINTLFENGVVNPINQKSIVGAANAIQYDFSAYLPNDLLRKVDTASMSVALEVRAPFLDTKVMEAALSTPVETLMLHDKCKGLLKRIAGKYLPATTLNRPKMGFAIPIGEWFRNDYGNMKTLLLDSMVLTDNPFGSIPVNQMAVQKIIDEHLQNRIDHSQRLFMLLTLAIWAKQL